MTVIETIAARKCRVADKVLDRDLIVDGARIFAAETDFLEILPPLHSPAFGAAVMRIIDLPQATVLLAEDDDGLAGGIGLLVVPYLWNPDILAADELFWWCRPTAPPRTALHLLRAARAFAIAASAKVLTFGALSNSPPGVARAYRCFGMRPVQTSYLAML